MNVLEQVGAALTFEETFKPARTRAIEEQRRKQPLLSTTTTQEITEIQTRPITTTTNLLQFNQHQAMTPPCVINTHMTNHVLQQQNTPTREHPTSHLSRHSTPIWQRTTNTAATVTNIILKTRCRFQLDKGMPRVFSDTKRSITESFHPQIPRPTGKLHPVHGCFKICIC